MYNLYHVGVCSVLTVVGKKKNIRHKFMAKKCNPKKCTAKKSKTKPLGMVNTDKLNLT